MVIWKGLMRNGNMYQGRKLATGAFICLLHHDDLFQIPLFIPHSLQIMYFESFKARLC